MTGHEKVTESIKVHLPEKLKRDIQDQAMVEDRTASDWIRRTCELHLYGIVGCSWQQRNGEVRGEEGRANG
jgi:hypothetical protein